MTRRAAPMSVTLVNHTPDPLTTLIWTKSTRLHMTAGSFGEIRDMPMEDKMAELEYMKSTIKSSWEFVDFIFLIENVSRAFTHQLVRHRVGTSFAQQTQRSIKLSEFEYITGPSIAEDESLRLSYEDAMDDIGQHYESLVRNGAKRQDARGVIPTNVSTNIIFKANLRTLHEMARVRLCVKTQGEFQGVFRAMREAVVERWPWMYDMIQVECGLSGTCIFPTFPTEDCPVKPFVHDPTTGESYGGGKPLTLPMLRNIHTEHRAEAQPVVKSDD